MIESEEGYFYFSKTLKPFKTPGTYGYSHGGISPQELITPYFCWKAKIDTGDSLNVIIDNKDELKSVTGNLYQVKIKADKGKAGIFSNFRKVYLVFFSNNEMINKSDFFTINKGDIISKEYSFDGNSKIKIKLLDASSNQELDSVIVRQNKDRDLGGLL